MSAETMLLAALGIIQLIINITTMFLTLPGKNSVRFSVTVLIIFTLSFISILILTDSINNGFTGFIGLVYLPIMIWLFKGHLFQKMFAFFLQYLLTTLLISLAVVIACLFLGNDINVATVAGLMANTENSSDIAFTLVLVLAILAAYTILMFMYGRLISQKIFIHGHPAEWALYSFGALFSFAVTIVIRNMPISAWQHFVILLFILWSFVILCFAIITTHEKSEQRYEAEFARDVISTGSEHYQKMNEMYGALRVMRHDYKYHLDTISELLNSGEEREAEKYLTDIQKQLSENELSNYCTNTVLNALLVSYSERCAKQNIKYDIEITMPSAVTIPNYEMCIVLGNLLENAVEACSRYDGKRVIELRINTQGAHLAVMVKNCYSCDLNQGIGMPENAKESRGLGLRSVQAVASRYGGELMTEWDNTTFTAYVLMQTLS